MSQVRSEKLFQKKISLLGQASSVFYLGIFLAICIVIGYFFGSYIDRKLHTSPWFLLMGVLCGVAAGLFEIIRVAKKSARLMNEAQPKR